MATITIQVDDEIAQAYQAAAIQKQQDASFLVNLMVKELLTPTPFKEIVQQIRAEAEANGLTPEILAELLEDE